jgi:hypothetical protein
MLPCAPMRYRLRSSDSRQVVLAFSMPERPLIISFLAIVCLVCLLIGLAYAISPEKPGDSLRALSFTGFGMFCLSAIVLFSGAYQRAFPFRLVFDNERAQLELFNRKGAPIGTVPYDGISGFTVCRTVDDRVSRCSLGIDFARGGRWELYASQRRGPVDAFQQALAAAVKVKTQPGAAAQTSPADQLSVDRPEAGVLRVAWRRTSHPFSLAVSLVILISFACTLAGVRPFGEGAGAWIAAAAFGAFFLLAAAVSILRTIGERMEVRLGRGTLEYRHRSALTRPKGFTRTLSQVAAVDYSMTFSRVGTRIVALQPQEVEQFVRYRQGTFAPTEVPGMVSFLRSLARIDVSALELEQRLALAELIREAVTGDRSKPR